MSGSENNTTLSSPGRGWSVLWTTEFSNFQLDIVGFLAILGEGAVSANAQVAALSRLFYLPRLMPAPNALLPPTRPRTLPPSHANIVTAVRSGNIKDHVHHIASILLDHPITPFTVRCVEVKKRNPHDSNVTIADRFLRGLPSSRSQPKAASASTVKAKATGPLAIVMVLGFVLSIILFILSLCLGDGWSMLATVMLSLLSTLIGVGNKWELRLPTRPKNSRTPPGDVVIRYPVGSYLIVRCDENVARELYFAPEEIEYSIKSSAVYRIISLIGTLLLMMGVVCLANARLQLQLAWLAAYVVMNIAYWTVAALPHRLHWDMSCYEVTEQSVEGGPTNTSFTEALWKAILLTKSIEWVRIGKAAPQTPVWDKWLKECERRANTVNCHRGPLIDPYWSKNLPADEGVVWEVPKYWDAKDAYDVLQNEQLDAKLEKVASSPEEV